MSVRDGVYDRFGGGQFRVSDRFHAKIVHFAVRVYMTRFKTFLRCCSIAALLKLIAVRATKEHTALMAAGESWAFSSIATKHLSFEGGMDFLGQRMGRFEVAWTRRVSLPPCGVRKPVHARGESRCRQIALLENVLVA